MTIGLALETLGPTPTTLGLAQDLLSLASPPTTLGMAVVTYGPTLTTSGLALLSLVSPPTIGMALVTHGLVILAPSLRRDHQAMTGLDLTIGHQVTPQARVEKVAVARVVPTGLPQGPPPQPIMLFRKRTPWHLIGHMGRTAERQDGC